MTLLNGRALKTFFSFSSYAGKINIKHQFHPTSAILIKTFNSLPTDWDRASNQNGESDLIQLITEGKLRQVSGPAQYNNESVTSIALTWILKKNYEWCKAKLTK